MKEIGMFSLKKKKLRGNMVGDFRSLMNCPMEKWLVLFLAPKDKTRSNRDKLERG